METGSLSFRVRLPRRAPGTVARGVRNPNSGFVRGTVSHELETRDCDLAKLGFAALATQLAASEQEIVAELAAVQGAPVDIGGYYHPNETLAAAAMLVGYPASTIAIAAIVDVFQ